AAVALTREEGGTRRAADDRVGEVALRRGPCAAAGRICGCSGRADRECRPGCGVPCDQFLILPRRTIQSRAEGVVNDDRQLEGPGRTTVLRFHRQAGRRRGVEYVLFRIAGAIPATTRTGAVQAQVDAARNAKVCAA